MATGKGNTFITDLLELIFNATGIANIADNASSGPLTDLYLSLHTADPGAGGSQTTSEAAYTSYARAAVARSSGGFTVSGQSVVLASDISFPAGSGGGETCTYVAVGTASSGSGMILYRCTLTPNVVTGNGITPIVKAGGTGISEA